MPTEFTSPFNQNQLRVFTAEFIGTFALVFFGAGAVCVNHMTGDALMRPGLAGIALAQGLILAVALSVTLHISGGFLNPAVTLMLWSFNRLDNTKMLCNLFAQALGAALAGLCQYLKFSENILRESHFGTPHVNLEAFDVKHPGWDVVLTCTGIEIALTFFLVFAIFGTILDTRGQKISGLMVGLALAGVTFVGYPLTGAAANPARWIGTVIWERLEQDSTLGSVSPFADMFVYIAGPILGALLCGIVYYKVILPAGRSDGVLDMPAPPEDKIAPNAPAVPHQKTKK